MYNREEIDTPAALSDKIDAAIAAGIRKGREEAASRRVRARRRLGSAAAACLLLTACLLTLRVSPAFAAWVRDIPGFESFVDLIGKTQDKGIRLAVDNDFVQPVGVSDEHEGTRFTVQGIIVDDSRMVVIYDIAVPDRETIFQIGGHPQLTGTDGKSLPAMIGFSYPEEAKQDIRKTGVQRGMADFTLSPGETFPDEVSLALKLIPKPLPREGEEAVQPMMRAGSEGADAASTHITEEEGADFRVRFRIDRARFAGLLREYPLGQTLDVEGQSVTFAKAVVSPLKVSVYLDYASDNAEQIFGPGDIRLVDEKGTVWQNTSGSLEKDHHVFHFESPYFTEPKELYVEGSWFRALDKDKLTVKVDLNRWELLEAPDDKLALTGPAGSGVTRLVFRLKGMDEEDHMLYSLFDSTFTDASGQTFELGDRGASGNVEEQHVYYDLEKHAYKQPITLTLRDYPEYIRQPYRIRIK